MPQIVVFASCQEMSGEKGFIGVRKRRQIIFHDDFRQPSQVHRTRVNVNDDWKHLLPRFDIFWTEMLCC